VVRDGESPSFTSVLREAEPCSVSVVRDGKSPSFTSVVRDGESPSFTSVAHEVYAMAGTTCVNVALTTP
jgi:hypothetical protein